MTASLALALQAAPIASTCPLALVARGTSNARISVYRTPSAAARKTAKLQPGSPLFVCGGNAEWFWVHYSDRRHSCRGTANGLSARYASTCASGWVPRRHVAAVSR